MNNTLEIDLTTKKGFIVDNNGKVLAETTFDTYMDKHEVEEYFEELDKGIRTKENIENVFYSLLYFGFYSPTLIEDYHV